MSGPHSLGIPSAEPTPPAGGIPTPHHDAAVVLIEGIREALEARDMAAYAALLQHLAVVDPFAADTIAKLVRALTP